MTNTIHSQGDPEASILTTADGLGILSLVIVLLLVSFLHSRHTMFSGDEIMTLFVLNQPNFHSLLEVWRAGIDSSGIWFYVFGRPWVAVFGASEISLRLYSASGIAAAAAIIWIAARRYYSILPVAAAVSFVFASTHVIRWQLAYGRTYGVFLLAAALVLYLIIRGEDIDRPSPAFLIATLAAYTFLMGSHILGILYVGAFLGLQLILDYRSRRFRPWLYMCASASVFVFLFSLQNLRTTAALGKPSFWSVRPSVKDLVTLTGVIDHRVTGALVFVAVLILLHIKGVKVRPQRTLIYLLIVLFVALDLFFFAYSHVTTSIYVDRYMLPFNLVGALVLCELLTQLREAEAPLRSLRYGLPYLFLVLAVAGSFVPRLQRPWFPLPNYTQNLADTLPPALPVVDTDIATFVEMEFYRHDAMHRRWMYPVDWSVALDPESTGGASGPHELDNLKAVGFYPSDIIPTKDVLSGQQDFIVLSNHPDVWLKRRILADPHFTATKLGSYQMNLVPPIDIWMVHAGS